MDTKIAGTVVFGNEFALKRKLRRATPLGGAAQPGWHAVCKETPEAMLTHS